MQSARQGTNLSDQLILESGLIDTVYEEILSKSKHSGLTFMLHEIIVAVATRFIFNMIPDRFAKDSTYLPTVYSLEITVHLEVKIL